MNAPLPRTELDLRPLRTPIWSALTTHHADLAIDAGAVRLYPEDVSPFGAFDPSASEACSAFVAMARERTGGVGLMQADPVRIPPGIVCSRKAQGVQMVPDRQIDASLSEACIRLLPMDVPEMLRLVARTEPGPFGARTHLLGAYWGIRVGGELIAMAGERLRLPGYCEISAVCVHPEHRGKGFARRLVAHVAAGILARGEVPFLHAYADNRRALALYSSMGFRISQPMRIATLVAD